MTLDQFVGIVKERLPTAEEWVAVCDELGIEFGTNADGNPCMKGDADNRQERIMLASILGREPWRTQVLQMRGMKTPTDYLAYEAANTEPRMMELFYANGRIETVPFTGPPGPIEATHWRIVGSLGWSVVPLRNY